MTICPLSEREQDILSLVCQGHTNREIAKRLGIAPKTVETYLARAYQKLEVRNRVEAAVKFTIIFTRRMTDEGYPCADSQCSPCNT